MKKNLYECAFCAYKSRNDYSNEQKKAKTEFDREREASVARRQTRRGRKSFDFELVCPTDLYWMEGMHEKRPVSEILSDLKRSENITDDGKSFLLISRILLIILVIVGLTYCRFSASEKHEIYENQHGWP